MRLSSHVQLCWIGQCKWNSAAQVIRTNPGARIWKNPCLPALCCYPGTGVCKSSELLAGSRKSGASGAIYLRRNLRSREILLLCCFALLNS